MPFITGVGFGGAGNVNANFSNTPTGTYTLGGKSYKYIRYTSSSTLTVTKAGYADVLIVAGGGNGGPPGYFGGGGGGAGGFFETSMWLDEATYTITVAGANGNSSISKGSSGVRPTLITYAGGGGGGGWPNNTKGGAGGSGGGGGYGGDGDKTGGAALYGGIQGNNGGFNGGAGGGAGGTPTGRDSTITGTAVTYSRGGGGASTTPNTGNGGNGNAAGQSGVVIVRVVV